MENQIRHAQIDPNGLCNAGCWFCPIAYLGNPVEHINQMTPEEFRNIIKMLHDNKGGIVHPDFNGIYGSHYNEFLLYRYLREMFETLREFKMGIVVLTNGTPLTPAKTDLINEFQDVVWGVCVNAPVWTDEITFHKRTGMAPGLFKKLKSNVAYAAENLENKNLLSLQINGHDRESGALKGPKFPKDIEPYELDVQVAAAKAIFPNVRVFKQPHLIDRVGLIDEYISSSPFIKDTKVIGCQGKRDTEWIHVNANSELFLCCNDFEMEHKYGNLKENDLTELWMSDKHKEVMQNAFDTICAQCTSAIFE